MNRANQTTNKHEVSHRITIHRLEALSRPMVSAAVHSPPKHSISAGEYNHFLSQLGTHYLIAWWLECEITTWGSRLTTVKGRNLMRVIQHNNLSYLSTGEPTYWSTAANKIPDLLHFAITNKISDLHTTIESNLDLASDNGAVTITTSANIILKETPPRLGNRPNKWSNFKHISMKKIV
jgi:hypothetical protein